MKIGERVWAVEWKDGTASLLLHETRAEANEEIAAVQKTARTFGDPDIGGRAVPVRLVLDEQKEEGSDGVES